MKILCILYIITVFLSEVARTRYRPEPKRLLQNPDSAQHMQQARHLIKTNDSHSHEDDNSRHNHQLVQCHPPPPPHQNPRESSMTESVSLEAAKDQPGRGKRDAQTPRRRRRRGPPRRLRRVSRIKAKRAQPVVVVEAERPMIQPSPPSPTKPSPLAPSPAQQPQQPAGPASSGAPVPPPGVTTNGEDPSRYPGRNQQRSRDKDESNRGSSQLLLTVLLCLLIASLSGLLLLYLYCRSQKQSRLNSFFCPPDSARSRDNLTDLDRCTCCSGATYSGSPDGQYSGRPRAASKQERHPVAPPREKPSKKASKSTPKKTKEKKPQQNQKQEFSSSSPSPTPNKKKPPCFSEAELREIQSKIAYILRHQCVGCKCCKCNALHISKPKPSRFKLFRKKKPIDSLCDDLRCGENKIKCIGRLYGTADPYDSRTSNTDVCRTNPWDKSASRAKPRAGDLRIRE